jgi:hypothetical protein
MTPQERLDRALSARAAPAKDMHFTLEVMRHAEAERFRAEATRRLAVGGGLAALVASAIVPAAGWVAENGDTVLDAGLAVGGVVALMTMFRTITRPAPRRTH